MQLNQEFLNDYFKDWYWNPNKYPLSGERLLTMINDSDHVLDVGCGSNPFKGRIKHLVGIDPANDLADVKCTIEDYSTDQRFDVALCLGSIQFGTEEDFVARIAKIVTLMNTKATIIFRAFPLSDLPDSQIKGVPCHGWAISKVFEHAAQFGFTVASIEHEEYPGVMPGVIAKRLVVIWQR